MWKQDSEDRWTYWQNGKQITGWVQDNGKWFMCGQDDIYVGWYGDMQTGKWFYLHPQHGYDFYKREVEMGEMATGWVFYNNNWYYLANWHSDEDNIERGQMLCNDSFTLDGKLCTFDKDGKWINNENGVSDKGIDFIKSYEGYFATPYYDCVGVKTLGYGMTGSEIEGLTYVSEPQATQMLKDLVNKKYYPPIKKALDSKGILLSQNKIDALVSMAYNVGYAGVLGSTLFRNICNGVTDENTIYNNFIAWSKAGGRTISGLLRRRKAEANIYLYGVYNNN